MPNKSHNTVTVEQTAEEPIPFHRVPAEIERITKVRINLATVYRWKQRGKLAAFKLGGRAFVEPAELRRFINEGRNPTAAAN